MTAYSYSALPETDLKELPPEVHNEALGLISSLIADSSGVIAVNLSGGHIYDNHGEISVDTLGTTKSRIHGDPDDDIVLQVTVRFDRFDSAVDALVTKAEAVADRISAEKLRREQDEIDGQIAALQARRARLGATRL